MSSIGSVTEKMIRAGVDPALIREMLDAFSGAAAAVQAPQQDSAADRRRAWDRERQAKRRAEKRASQSGGQSTGSPPDDQADSSGQGADAADRAHDARAEVITSNLPKTSYQKAPLKGGQKGKVSACDRGTFLPDGWQPDHDHWQSTVNALGSAGAERELAKFRNFWLAKSGKDGRKRDWSATWRNWIIRAVEDAQQRGARNGSDRDTVAAARDLVEQERRREREQQRSIEPALLAFGRG